MPRPNIRAAAALVLFAAFSAPAFAQGGGGGGGGPPRFSPLLMESTAFKDGGIVPQKNAGRDELLAAMAGKIVAKAAYVGRYRSAPPPQ